MNLVVHADAVHGSVPTLHRDRSRCRHVGIFLVDGMPGAGRDQDTERTASEDGRGQRSYRKDGRGAAQDTSRAPRRGGSRRSSAVAYCPSWISRSSALFISGGAGSGEARRRRPGAVRRPRPHHARGHRRHDRQRQDRPWHRLLEEAAHRRHPGDRDRSQGRPRQPAAHVPRAARRGLRAVGRRGRGARAGHRRRRARRARRRRGGRAWPTWGQDGARIAPARATPPSSRSTRRAARPGVPLSILGSFAAPRAALRADAELLARARSRRPPAGLLGLAGVDADPLRSREHILVATLCSSAWRDGRDLDLAGLIAGDPDAALRRASASSISSPSSPPRSASTLALR